MSWRILASILVLVPLIAGCTSVSASAPDRTTGKLNANAVTASQAWLRADETTLTLSDVASIMEMARENLPDWQRDNFADVAETPVTASEASGARLGDVERCFSIVPSQLRNEPSLFSAMRVRPEMGVSVPVLVGDRRIAEFYFQKEDGTWSGDSVGSESRVADEMLARLNAALVDALGGAPDETRRVDVDGSHWIVARRGEDEVAGFNAMLAYGSFGDLSVTLPVEGSVLTSSEFRALLGQMRTP